MALSDSLMTQECQVRARREPLLPASAAKDRRSLGTFMDLGGLILALTLGKLVRIAGAFRALPNRHVTDLWGTALVVPSGDGLGFHLGVCRLCLRLTGHARSMALGRGGRYAAEPSPSRVKGGRGCREDEGAQL